MTDQSDLAISKDVLQLLSRLIFTSLQKSLPNVPMYAGRGRERERGRGVGEGERGREGEE
jgi:hypothetical protein